MSSIESPIKYQVFVSSTYVDLKDERQRVVETILKQYHFPIGMEMFSADDDEQWNVIKKTIDTSDIYILIIGHRYGSLTKGKRISYTEKEFDYALQRKNEGNLKLLCFIRDRDVEISGLGREVSEELNKKLDKFIKKVKKNTIIETWKKASDLSTAIAVAIPKIIAVLNSNSDGRGKGWIKRYMSDHQISELERLSEIKKTMLNVSKESETINEDIEVFDIDEKGNCTICRTRTSHVSTDTTYSYTQFVADADATGSKVITITELSSGETLQHLVSEASDKKFSFFILYDRRIKAGTSIKYYFEVKVKNYLFNLIQNGHGHIGFIPFKNTKFHSKKDLYKFPDIPFFKNLKVTVIQVHPGKKVNKVLEPRNENGKKIFTYDYGKLKEAVDILIEFVL